MPPKRKRNDRNHEGGRPSPHRPSDTQMGQRDRDNMDSPGRGGRGGGRQPRRNDRRDSYQNQHNHASPNHQRPASPVVSRQQSAPSQAAPPPNPTPLKEQTAASITSLPSPAPSNYSYDILTDDKISSWSEYAAKVVEHGVQSREDVDIVELSNLFQEFIQSVADGRLDPTIAGSCIKEVIGSDSKEIIKDSFSFEPHKLFLDTISTVVEDVLDLDVGNRPDKLRAFLIATDVSPALMRQVMDAPLLHKIGLTREAFFKHGIRHATNLLYRQANYNLLREESEGYSKLLTELFTSFNDVSSSDVPSTEAAVEAFERIKALIGTFDLDVGRVLDVALDVYATSVVKASKFFVKLLRVSSWWPRSHVPNNTTFAGGLPHWAVPGAVEVDESTITELKRQRDVAFWDRARESQIQAWFELGGRQVTKEDLAEAKFLKSLTAEEADAARTWMDVTKTLPPQGNRVAAQLLGFKLRFYASDFRDDEVLPANLLYLAALLIKIGFISIVDLYPHLWPYDDEMEDFRDEKMKEVEAEERKKRGGGQPNALLMAGALRDDEVVPGAPSRLPSKPSAESSAKASADSSNPKPRNKPMEQKGALVISLLTIGAIPEALFLIGLWPWLTEAFPDINDRINRIVEYSIEKIYQESQPITSRPLLCSTKQMPDADQGGVVKGTVRLSEMPPRKAMRWPYPDGRQGPGDQPYRFFWDDWADNVPICQTIDDFLALADTLLKISGPNIGKNPKLVNKLLRIGQKSLADDNSQGNLDRWQDILTKVLVPSLSATESSVTASDSLWSLLKLYPTTTRFSIYAEWFEGAVSRQPAMKTFFARTKAATQGVMKRVSNKNLTDSAKTLAKASHSSPGIVCKVALEQISSYANLTDAMVECARYFTDLSKDVLVWSLLGALGSNQRSRTQASYILSVSAWLQALSGFTGKVFKRYHELDVTPILQYVNDQLFNGKSTDLIILEELTLSMGGIVKMIDISDEQVMAMSGLSLLQKHTLQNMRDNRFNSTKSAKHLMKALLDSSLAGRLLVNIAQFRQSASFRLADDGAHIKFLSTMMDNSHQILVQYLDLLRTNLEPEEFDKVVPSISALMVDFGLDAGLAFMIGRDSLAAHIFTKASPAKPRAVADKDGDVAMGEDATPSAPNGSETTPAEDSQPATQKDDSQSTSSGLIDVVQPVIDSIIATTPPAIWSKMSAEFFVVFWALQLRDIQVPWKSYSIAQERLSQLWRELSKDRSDMTRAGINAREAKKAAASSDTKKLMEEGQEHQGRAAKAKIHITRRFSHWFTGKVENLNGVSDAIIEQCLFPRLTISKMDTEYSYQLIRSLHEWSCPNFRLKVLYDRLFNSGRLRSMLFTCTVGEAELLGRFYHRVLRDLSRWHEDRQLYEKEAIGKTDNNVHGKLGFGDKFNDEGKAISHIQHEDFRGILFGWHKSLNVALKACLTGTEWMHIRNAISFITAVHELFPAIDFMGEQMYAQFDAIAKREEHSREDLSTLANGVLSVLARRKSKWVRIQAFRTSMAIKDTKNEKPAAASSLRPSAPTFQPKIIGNEDEDGEVKDGGKSQSAGPPTARSSTPLQPQNANRNLPPRVTSQREPATTSAAMDDNLKSNNGLSQPSQGHNRPSVPHIASNGPSRQATPGVPPNRNTVKPQPHPNLPARPPGPIPESVPQGRFGPPQSDRRDNRDRDIRNPRDGRDSRSGESGRQDRGRDFSYPERRGQDMPPTREPGRLNERDRVPRTDSQPPRRDHAPPVRDDHPASERHGPARGRTPDIVRAPREAPIPVTALSAKGEEPPMNPARAALIQDATPDRPERSDRHGSDRRPRPQDHDQRGRPPPRHAEADLPELMNAGRAAPFKDSGPRAPRDDPRDRTGARNGSPPRRSARQPLGPEPGPEDFGRPPYHDSRPHGREPRGDSYQAPPPRGPERDDRTNVESTREAFLGRGPEADHGRSRQDDSYGRLNPIQSVMNETPTAPSGPRGRGGQRGGRSGGNNSINTPPPHPRFPPHGDHSSVGPDDRHPPTGPGGRGRQHHQPGPVATPPQPERPRQAPTGPAATPGNQGSGDTPASGVHPSRLAQINGPNSSPMSAPRPQNQGRSTQARNTPDRPPPHGNRDQPGNQAPSQSQNMAPPSGPAGTDRRKDGSRGSRQLEGINSILRPSARQSLANSDAQVLTGGSPVTTPSHERTNPMGSAERTPANGSDDHSRGDRDRSHKDRDRSERSGRSSRRHSPERARDRERSPTREREGKERSEYKERRNDASSGRSGREDRDRESRRSGRDASSNNSREQRNPAVQGSNSEPLGQRDSRHRHHDRSEGAPLGRSEDWGGSTRSRGGPREGNQRSGENRMEPPREERSRKRRSDDAQGFQPDKRPRH